MIMTEEATEKVVTASETIFDDMSRIEIIDLVKKEIPILDIEVDQFTEQEIKNIASTLIRNKDVFDTIKVAYGAARGVQHSIDT